MENHKEKLPRLFHTEYIVVFESDYFLQPEIHPLVLSVVLGFLYMVAIVQMYLTQLFFNSNVINLIQYHREWLVEYRLFDFNEHPIKLALAVGSGKQSQS